MNLVLPLNSPHIPHGENRTARGLPLFLLQQQGVKGVGCQYILIIDGH